MFINMSSEGASCEPELRRALLADIIIESKLEAGS